MVNLKPKTTVKLRASAKCPTHALSNIQIRDLEFAIDEPTERGGSNLGPTPTETALAALIGCTNVIGNKCAEKLNVDIGHLDITAVCDFDRRGVTLQEDIDVPFTRIVLTVWCDGEASETQLEQVAQEVSKYCPLSKLFRQAGTVVEENWSKRAD